MAVAVIVAVAVSVMSIAVLGAAVPGPTATFPNPKLLITTVTTSMRKQHSEEFQFSAICNNEACTQADLFCLLKSVFS